MTHLPLAGRMVLVTRPVEQAEPLASLLLDRGAQVLVEPLISIGPAPDAALIATVLSRLNLNAYQWVLFVSRAGVAAFLAAMTRAGIPESRLHSLHVAAIGPGTADALRQHGVPVAAVPDKDFSSEGLAELLRPRVAGTRILLVRADRGRDLLRNRLSSVAEVDEAAFYTQNERADFSDAVRAAWIERKIDIAVVTSGASARLLRRLAEQAGETQRIPQLVAISAVTAAAIEEIGWPVAGVALAATLEGLVESICNVAQGGDDQEGSSRMVSQAK